MRLLVCGSRDWTANEAVYAVLTGIYKMHCEETFDDWPPDRFVIISGAARGADTYAAEWAKMKAGVDLELYPAKWREHGKAAGPIRNQQMLDEGKPNMVLAFSNFPLTTGTADMVYRAKQRGIVCWQMGNP